MLYKRLPPTALFLSYHFDISCSCSCSVRTVRSKDIWKRELTFERGVTARMGGGGGEEVIYKALNGEAPPGGPTPYPFVYHFDRLGTPFTYFHKRPVLWSNRQITEVFLTFSYA